MKKVFTFFAILGISLGLFLAVRNEVLNQSSKDKEENNQSTDKYIHELNIPIMEIDTLDPIATNNKQVLDILELVYEPLVKINKDEEIEGVLADSWAELDDLTWIIKLRDNAKWQNGGEFTSSDVYYTFESIISREGNIPFKANIKNISSIEIIDKYSVKVNLYEKDSLLMYKLTFPIISSTTLNGTGKYKSSYINDEEIKLSINESWWNYTGTERLRTIYLKKYTSYSEAIKGYKSTEVDLITTSAQNWEKKFGTIGSNYYSYESSLFEAIIPNCNRLLLSDSSVRKAILFAINAENISQRALSSNVSLVDMPIHTKSNNFVPGITTEYSLDKAKQVLINAGWSFNKNVWQKSIFGSTYSLRFTLLVNSENEEQKDIATKIKESLADLGISITVKALDWGAYSKAINNRDFDLALASFDIKNETTIIEMLKENGVNNFAGYSSNDMKIAINKALENDFSEGIKDIQKVWKDETPYIGLWFRNNTILTNKSVKGSIEPIWSNPYENISTWCK